MTNARTLSILPTTSGALVIGYTPSGPGAVATTVQTQLNRTACDLNTSGSIDAANTSALPCGGVVSVNLTRTLLDKHAFEDLSSLLVTSGSSLGYSSFDAKPTMTNSVDQLHLVSYQARPTFAGSGNLTQYLHGFDTAAIHSGTGQIAEVCGVSIRDITGSGAATKVTVQYGVKVDTLAGGLTKWGMYSGDGNQHYLGGATGTIYTGAVAGTALNFNTDTAGKYLAYGYGSNGQVQVGYHRFYNGKNTWVATIQYDGGFWGSALDFQTDAASKTLYYGFGGAGAVNPGYHTFYGGKNNQVARISALGLELLTVTFANLPIGPVAGAVIYVSNGRKVGEGAGAGTGVPAYYSNTAWRVFSTDAAVTS